MSFLFKCCDGIARVCDLMCAPFCLCLYAIFALPCKLLAKCFRARFSLCLLLSTIINLVPAILMIIAMAQSMGYPCRTDWLKGHFVVLGILNFINWAYTLYLVNRYGNKYSIKGGEAPGRDNFVTRTTDIILYDIVNCCMIPIALFELAWLIIGIVMATKEPKHSSCYDANGKNTFPTIYLLNLIGGWAMWLTGVTSFLYTLAVYGCADGSYNGRHCCSCLCRVLTCGLYDPLRGKDINDQAYRVPAGNERMQRRSKWLTKAQVLLTGASLYRGVLNEQDNRPTEVNIEAPMVQQPMAVAPGVPAPGAVVVDAVPNYMPQTGMMAPGAYAQPAPVVANAYNNYNPTGMR